MQQSASVSKLKRQISFLKSIDQKLEGLRRENERLRRIVSNPRVRFSRSSLGGLHRIVNSLKTAGPFYHIASIEVWADRANDWLADLGKRGEGPSNDELDWLAETINELGDVRDVAMAEIESLVSEAGGAPEVPKDTNRVSKNTHDASENVGTKDDVVPKDRSRAPDRDTHAAKNPDDATEDTVDPIPKNIGIPDFQTASLVAANMAEPPEPFPFNDQPVERSIAEAKFWKEGEKRSRSKGHRDRTSTIPLMITDLTSITPPPAAPAIAPPPLPVRNPGIWRPFAVLSFLGCLVMTALFFMAKREADVLRAQVSDSAGTTSPVAPTVGGPVVVSGPGGEPAETDSGASHVEAAEAQAPGKASEPPKDNEATEVKSTSNKKSNTAPPQNASPSPKQTQVESSENRSGKSSVKRAERKISRAPAKKEEKQSDAVTGTLVVKSPEAGGSVLVLVDGVSRGKSPARVKLSPGLHELVFMKDGKKKIRMVPIRPDATKTITAVIPE